MAFAAARSRDLMLLGGRTALPTALEGGQAPIASFLPGMGLRRTVASAFALALAFALARLRWRSRRRWRRFRDECARDAIRSFATMTTTTTTTTDDDAIDASVRCADGRTRF